MTINTLDDLLDYYLEDISPTIIRLECLIKDLKSFFAICTPEIDDRQVENAFQVKDNVRTKSQESLFSDYEIKQLYLSSPNWAAFEANIYNDY